jgi:hypothetical protein
MEKEVFKSERYFTLFDFLISHGQLLLRASKDDDYNKNIDIIFYDVKFLQLATHLKGVSIKQLTNNNISNDSIKSIISKKDNSVFEIKSNNELYYITAAFIKVFENDLEFNETSLGLFQNKGREREIAGTHYREQ